MTRLKKGMHTHHTILLTAKKLFYEKGFLDTAVKEICKQADVKLGTFTYYFNTKEVLVSEIYQEYFVKVYTWTSFFENRKMNSLEKNVIATFLYYHIIFCDEKNMRFHYEVLSKQSPYTYLSEILKRIYANIVRDFKLDIDEEELIRIMSADLGMRRELILAYTENKMFNSSLDLAITIYTMMGRLFKIDEKIMNEYIKKAIEFLEKNDLSRIKFLV
jgi:AcrR family transcriptional regulator